MEVGLSVSPNQSSKRRVSSPKGGTLILSLHAPVGHTVGLVSQAWAHSLAGWAALGRSLPFAEPRVFYYPEQRPPGVVERCSII